ncbi:hypothetical protein EJ03DRAFT_269323 [Teratosphaeria nubilosa]|uniref:Zn(2)-C6 fungal-type domain-containing protein n=1 Tax=Teratosphaeria nubilosa TaxID=161662 RepID=A0A6G1LEQ0_9PEZI|nr:hypothetical protein EJ03DRAFT_269323 [Teratosphaeria nubilosa]
MAPRSRTGCLTCRQRKLKCSEERPVCAQCVKANRECVPASAITFRHQQNPSMSATERGSEQLKSFYGYKETFSKETTWVHIPQHLTFVTTTNPYDDEDAHPHPSSHRFHPSPPTDDAALASSLAALAEDAARYEQVRSAPDYPFTPTVSDYATHGLEALSAVASQDQYNYAPPPAPMGHGEPVPLQPPSTTSPSDRHATSSGPPNNNLDFLLNPDNPNIDPRLHSETPVNDRSHPPVSGVSAQHQSSPTHVRTPTYASSLGGPRLHSKGSHARRPMIDDPQLAFLLRDFSERAGLWMDLFDLNLFFATKVPVLAKHLARVDGRKPTMGGQVTTGRRSSMEVWPGIAIDALGYVQKAREYYDLAVSLLRQSLAGATSPRTPSLPGNVSPQTARNAHSVSLPPTDSDELVAATAILCVYEFLDASGPEWSRHLDGAKTLFDIANDRMVPLTLPPSPDSGAHPSDQRLADHFDVHSAPSRTLTQGRRAVFWNFARQDMLSAFINHTSTRLDTSDIPMWKSAGLRFTVEGYICPSNASHPDYDPDKAMEDDIVANALIWIIMKLVNFIAAGDDVPEHLSPVRLGVRQRQLLEYWGDIERQLQGWYDGLPDSFHPTAISPSSANKPCKPSIEEQWFPRPMCASAMQSYHFARIQLLHNRPHLSTTAPRPPTPRSTHHHRPASNTSHHSSPGSPLAPLRHASILPQSRAHAKEIVAIGLGRSDEGTRIHSVQPLWTAGWVLGADEEACAAETEVYRRCVVEQLRGIERDMGWASEYRVRSLLELSGLPGDWLGAEA